MHRRGPGRPRPRGSGAHLPAPRPVPSRSGGRFAPKPPSARKSHFPDTAGALAELCEECPRRAREAAPPGLTPPPSRACARDRPRPRPAPVPPRAARKARAPWQRDYRRRVLFILSLVPGNSAGRLPGAPPWSGGAGEGGEAVDQRTRGSWGRGEEEGKERILPHWGSLTLPRRSSSESTDSSPARSGSSFLTPREPRPPPGQQMPPTLTPPTPTHSIQ